MADDLKGLMASPEFRAADAAGRAKIIGQHSAKFAGMDEATQLRMLSTLESKYGPSAGKRQEAFAESDRHLLSTAGTTALTLGLPLAGMGAGQLLTRGLGGGMQAAGRMAGSALGGAAAGKITGEPGALPITGSPMVDQGLTALVGQAVPEVGGALGGKLYKAAKGAQGAKALTSFEDQAATKASERMQSAIPWWRDQFSKDHAGLADMVFDKGPELLSQGYGDAMAKIGPYVEGTPMLIPVPTAQRMKLNVKALERQQGPALGMPDEVVVDMGQVVKHLPEIRTKDPGMYRDLVRHVDRYLGDVTGLPSEFKKARAAYAEGSGFIEAMQQSGAIDPVTRRLRADEMGKGMIKKDVMTQAAPASRSPATRDLLREISPVTKPAPQRGEIGIRVPGVSRRIGPEMRGFEHPAPIRIPTATNVPGMTVDTPRAITHGIPLGGGALTEIAREALQPRRRKPDAE